MRTDSVKSFGLSGLGFAPTDLGINSTIAFTHALNLAERGFQSFRSHGDVATESMRAEATSDVAALRAMYQDDPTADWRVLCGKAVGLWVLDIPRPRDLEWLERDMGASEKKTWTVGRESGGVQQWYRGETGPEYTMNESLHATHAHLKASAPIPGSIHARTGERFHWLNGLAPGQCDLATFSLRWQLGLPRLNGLRITDSPVHRAEFRAEGNLPAKWK